MISWGQFIFQDACSPLMEELILFNDFCMTILTFILSMVLYMLVAFSFNKFISMNLLDNQFTEALWTLIPGLILIQIAIPSLILLYSLDESALSWFSLKSVGHQWFWSYQYPGIKSTENEMEFDSYMLKSHKNQFRLIEVDNRVMIPMNCPIRMLTTSSDVLHSWTIPSLGVKADACPGRLNQMFFNLNRPGVFYGQCSEICGANHSFMPISLESLPLDVFLKWTSI